MLYIPRISDYKPFYIQFSTGAAQDILSVYSVVVKAHDYPSEFKIKEPYKNNWHDQNGDDEYIPSGGLYIEAFTFNLECAMFAKGNTEQAAIDDLNAGIRAFQTSLRSGRFKTYDAYTGYGFKDVRLVSMQNVGSDNYRVEGKNARVIFSLTLKVNDPVTHMVLSGSNIVEG